MQFCLPSCSLFLTLAGHDTFKGHKNILTVHCHILLSPWHGEERALGRGSVVDGDSGRVETLPSGGQVLQRAALEVDPLLHSNLLLWGITLK